ncbi:MAG: hypothetical protein LH629_12415 [Ignavibacteria bacterium]|nr:hypothetical protein [Ignavibacteria bacterium]
MRPIFSPTDFIQIKGRGTRKHNFLKTLLDKEFAQKVVQPDKKNLKLFDFFANCEYFEKEFNYDEILKLPPKGEGGKGEPLPPPQVYDSTITDPLKTWVVSEVGTDGMKIDRMYFGRFEETIKENTDIQKLTEKRDLDGIEKYIQQNVFDKPEDFYNLMKLQSAAKIDRKLSLKEIIEKIFGFIPYFKSKDELLEDEFEKFDSRYLPDEHVFSYAKNYFKSYITDKEFREIIENKNFALLNANPNGDVFRKLTPELQMLIPEYIKENISINRFAG